MLKNLGNENFAKIKKSVAPAMPRGAAGEKFLKFDTFSCI